MLEVNIDNKDDNKHNTLKQAIRCLDWLKWKEVMQAKYDFLIENKT